ncbi:MAG: Colicin V production protein [uncultured Thiotrichaceae bacterium]|uniref:Colicin V production protein n=1 Tax=uncultured Thiotrichaceae bacterium TaxID=298394 RepID=A0A6S6TQ70_9GAMM|nr:MAG: Colicin V production protein [uncultured Thiotrichaceae bacterium]
MQMTATLLDLGILVLIVLSLLVGLIRGFVREAISLATWVAAIGFSLLYFKTLALELPFAVHNEIARLGIAFAIIFFSVLVIGAVINFLLSTAIASIGLGGFDRFLGAIFGALRGGLIIVLLIILMGITSFPDQSWWIESRLVPHFELGANWLKERVPEDFSRYLENTRSIISPP